MIEQDRSYTATINEVKNPLLQLQRSESLLRRLLQELGYKSPLKAFIIFINPEFHLYQATKNLPAIFPAQINRFMDKIIMIFITLSHFICLLEQIGSQIIF
ncbi:hypothetical protein [Cytobacillus sp. NCCP-133]|uniref:hypothetical protein n=1 Tax=Cytobacillus sp. NCCP-133 TaxID=766848 RepID=UPI003FA4CA96